MSELRAEPAEDARTLTVEPVDAFREQAKAYLREWSSNYERHGDLARIDWHGSGAEYHLANFAARNMEALRARLSAVEAEVKAFYDYPVSDLELENWSFQHFDFLDPAEKYALKLLADKAKKGIEAGARLSTLERELTESRTHEQQWGDLARTYNRKYRNSEEQVAKLTELNEILAENCAEHSNESASIALKLLDSRGEVAKLTAALEHAVFRGHIYQPDVCNSCGEIRAALAGAALKEAQK